MDNIVLKFQTLIQKEKVPSFIILHGISADSLSSSARSIASLLFNGDTVENNIDYIELQKETLTIDDIRDLQARVTLMPHGQYNVCVIHELEKASSIVQSALLKLTEDGSENTIIIATTTTIRTITPPLLSRASKFSISAVNREEMSAVQSALHAARENILKKVDVEQVPHDELRLINTLLQIKENAASPVISEAAVSEIIPLLL